MVRGRNGIVLAVLAAMAFTFSHMGCGSSSAGSAPPPGGSLSMANITLINNCAGLSINVLVNSKGGTWLSNGVVKCGSGQQCAVAPGTYPIDVGSNGLDFFVGTASDNATKAEVTYATTGFNFDISVITDASQCPDSCTQSSCCQQAFNQKVKITPSKGCRCVYCDSVTCPDAFHFPSDTTKQVNCASQTDVTVEFCPASACPGTGIPNCTTAQNAICNNSSDQPCTRDYVFCCPLPAYGGTHTCYCEIPNASCAAIPDKNGPCGSVLTNYCYVTR